MGDARHILGLLLAEGNELLTSPIVRAISMINERIARGRIYRLIARHDADARRLTTADISVRRAQLHLAHDYRHRQRRRSSRASIDARSTATSPIRHALSLYFAYGASMRASNATASTARRTIYAATPVPPDICYLDADRDTKMVPLGVPP